MDGYTPDQESEAAWSAARAQELARRQRAAAKPELIQWELHTSWGAHHVVELDLFGSIEPKCVVCGAVVDEIVVLFFRSTGERNHDGAWVEYGQDMLWNVPCRHFIVQNPRTNRF